MPMTPLNSSVVSDVLIKPHIAHIEFSLDGASVSPTRFGDVKRELDGGNIKVARDSSLPQNKCVYRYDNNAPGDTKNAFRMGFSSTGGSTDREALIVHEAVHAIFDVHSSPQVVKVSEAAAYVAQMLYFYRANKAAIDAGATPTFSSEVQREAWELSVAARNGAHTYSATDAADLYAALGSHDDYADRIDDTDDYDGV